MKKNDTISQVKNGFRLAGLGILFFLIAGFFFAGVDYLFFADGHSRMLGFAFLVISIPVMTITMNRWVKVLAGLLALAVLNGVLSFATGHLIANATEPISRLDAFWITAFFAVAAALASTLRSRELAAVDRVFILAFVFSFACLLGYEGTRDVGRIAPLASTDFALMGAALSFLVAMWAINQIKRRRGQRRRVGG